MDDLLRPTSLLDLLKVPSSISWSVGCEGFLLYVMEKRLLRWRADPPESVGGQNPEDGVVRSRRISRYHLFFFKQKRNPVELSKCQGENGME